MLEWMNNGSVTQILSAALIMRNRRAERPRGSAPGLSCLPGCPEIFVSQETKKSETLALRQALSLSYTQISLNVEL